MTTEAEMRLHRVCFTGHRPFKLGVPERKVVKALEKEIKQAINMRSACQAANLGVSLLLLGLIVPIWTRHNTKKKHAEALKLAQEEANKNVKIDESNKVQV